MVGVFQIFTYSGNSRGTDCANTTNNPLGINYLGETYGTSSACMQQGSVGWTVTSLSSGTSYKPGLSGAGCYQVLCVCGVYQVLCVCVVCTRYCVCVWCVPGTVCVCGVYQILCVCVVCAY